jgi:hypothetical protein
MEWVGPWRLFRYAVGKTLRLLGLRHDPPAAEGAPLASADGLPGEGGR